MDYNTCSINDAQQKGLLLDFFSEDQKKIQNKQYVEAILDSELTKSEYETSQRKLEMEMDTLKLIATLGFTLIPLVGETAIAANLSTTYKIGSGLFRAVSLAGVNYSLDRTKDDWSEFYSKNITLSEENTAYLIYKQNNDEIDDIYKNYKNNPKATKENLEKLESYINQIITTSGTPNHKQSFQNKIESLNLNSRALALSVLELKRKIDRNEITINQLEKQTVKRNGSLTSIEESLKIQSKFSELEKSLIRSTNSYKNFQEIQKEKLNLISNQMKSLMSRIDELKNKQDSIKNLSEKEQYSQLTQLKKELELSVLLSAGQDLNKKQFTNLLSEASKGSINNEELKKLLSDSNIKNTINNVAEAIRIGSELTNLAIQSNIMSKETATKVQGGLKVASGFHQIAVSNIATTAASTAAATAMSGGILGAITIISGLFSLLGPQRNNNNQLAEAFKSVFENEQKIMNEVHSLKDLTLRLHLQTQEYMHNELNYVNQTLYLIKSDTNFLIDYTVFGKCISLELEEKNFLNKSIDVKIKNTNWALYEDCMNQLFSLINKRNKKYILESIKRPETKNLTSDSRENEGTISKTNDNLIYLLDFAKQKLKKNYNDEDLSLKKLLGLMRFQRYNYKTLKNGLEELKNNYDQITPIDDEMLSFVKNSKINYKYLQEISNFTETLSKWAVILRRKENFVDFLKNEEIKDMMTKINSKEEKIEDIAPYIHKVATITDNLKGIVDSAMIQKNILDGNILLPFAWEIIENDHLKITNAITNPQGNALENLHTEEFDNIKKTILKNPIFLANTIRWGLYQGFSQLTDEEKQNFLEEYSLFLNDQKTTLMRPLISKLLLQNKKTQGNILNFEIQLFNEKEAELVFELKFYTQKLNDEINKKPTKYKEIVSEDLRNDLKIKQYTHEIDTIESRIKNKGKNQNKFNSFHEINQNGGLYLRFPGILDTIKLPTADELLEGTFIQTKQLFLETQTKATQLYLNYKALEKM